MSERENRVRIATWGIERVADAVDGRLAGGAHDGTIPNPTGVSTDTRRIDEGELFVALRGERFDAHDFVDEAFRRGAVAAVVEDASAVSLPEDVSSTPLIRVGDTRRALQELGEAIWRDARDDGLHTVDVTGSNGKTTTKELLAAVWSTRGPVHATPGNFNNAIGLPLTLCALPADCEHLVAELGANAPGEISELIRMAPGQERIITSIGYAHTEGFGSIDGVRRAKSEIAECADASTTVIVPESESESLRIGPEFPGKRVTFGFEPGADVQIIGYRVAEPDGFEVTLEGLGRRATFPIPLPGRHNARNLAAAVATAWARGLELDGRVVGERLLEVELPAGRWRTVECGDFTVVDDAYNANPSSVRASVDAFLQWASRRAERRRILVIGEMHELGERAAELHGAVAAEAAGRERVDGVCAVGAYADTMVEQARRDAPSVEVAGVDDAEAAAEWLLGFAPADVLLKASRAAELERIIDLIDNGRPHSESG